jgi:hypothetical protein
MDVASCTFPRVGMCKTRSRGRKPFWDVASLSVRPIGRGMHQGPLTSDVRYERFPATRSRFARDRYRRGGLSVTQVSCREITLSPRQTSDQRSPTSCSLADPGSRDVTTCRRAGNRRCPAQRRDRESETRDEGQDSNRSLKIVQPTGQQYAGGTAVQDSSHERPWSQCPKSALSPVTIYSAQVTFLTIEG